MDPTTAVYALAFFLFVLALAVIGAFAESAERRDARRRADIGRRR